MYVFCEVATVMYVDVRSTYVCAQWCITVSEFNAMCKVWQQGTYIWYCECATMTSLFPCVATG